MEGTRVSEVTGTDKQQAIWTHNGVLHSIERKEMPATPQSGGALKT